MESHLRALGILHLVWGSLSLLGGLVVLLVTGGLVALFSSSIHRQPDAAIAAPIVGFVGTFIALLIIATGIPGIIAGWGLLRYRSWARVLTIVLSAIHLLNIPLGTALGAYGLWALLSDQGTQFYEQRSGQSSPARWQP